MHVFLFNIMCKRESDNDNRKKYRYVCITTNQSDTKSNPNPNQPNHNPNPTTKHHAAVSIQLNIATCRTHPEKLKQDKVVAPVFTTFRCYFHSAD